MQTDEVQNPQENENISPWLVTLNWGFILPTVNTSLNIYPGNGGEAQCGDVGAEGQDREGDGCAEGRAGEDGEGSPLAGKHD